LHAHPHWNVQSFCALAQRRQGCDPFDGSPTGGLVLRYSMDDDQLGIAVGAQCERLLKGYRSWR
jgi:hypothetical protein